MKNIFGSKEDSGSDGKPSLSSVIAEKAPKGKKLLFYGIAAIVFLIVGSIINPLVIIHAGERGVVLNWGAVQERVLDEGLHFRMPVYQQVVRVNVQIQKAETDAASVSKDLQDVHTKIALNYHLLPDKVSRIYQTIGTDYKSRIIDPAVQEVQKAISARYSAEELITHREKVRDEVRSLLKTRLLTYDIVVDDFSIVNFQFSKEFNTSIEEKQVAQQRAQKASRDLERIKIEAEQKIASAKAEAESLRLQKEQVTPQMVQLRKIEASIKAIEKWDGKLPRVTSGNSGMFITIDEKDMK